MNDSLSSLFDIVILDAVEKTHDYLNESFTPIDELISMGELVDRLSIVNYKLYNLKSDVINRPDDLSFRQWASEQDVFLVEERSRLKKAIDYKLIMMIKKHNEGNDSCGYNPEFKQYGKNTR